MRLDLDALKELGRERTLTVTLECAGNGRLSMAPLPAGEPWNRGAVSTARWTGVPLREVLSAAVLRDDTRELAFYAHDPFARSLPLEKALDPDVLLAFEMNGL